MISGGCFCGEPNDTEENCSNDDSANSCNSFVEEIFHYKDKAVNLVREQVQTLKCKDSQVK